jgi:hypothetical protein
MHVKAGLHQKSESAVYAFERNGMRILGPMKENNTCQIKKCKAIPVTAVEAHRVETLRLAHFLYSSQMAVRLSALCASRPLPPGRFLVLIFVRG